MHFPFTQSNNNNKKKNLGKHNLFFGKEVIFGELLTASSVITFFLG